ncbi:MAG TPA: AAA family ATPase [Candidatus Onthomorpha intestinigallinarum]|uniref:AAA family ATPase n=1 Tax=Candidatus Onthomorpha intestinigallinarum TaxID=2840880 RepID=A0A9D1UHL2_9BACT|nr:AAA family ATPase [Candidatus Onthomorpha intestinigallinarum]
MIIIGITGTLGAGKGTIVEKLKKRGFKHYSVRDFLVEQIRQRGLEVNRDSMRELANELREKNGADYIVECLVGRAMAQGDDCVIESIRNPKEVETLRRIRNFHLFSVDADIHKRYERIRSRKSSTDNVSFETFVENEKKEMSSDNESGQNLSACMALADFRFNNDKDIEDLDRQVEDALKSIEKEMRPSWDEYFMDLANAASKRATCDRGRSGCVIVKDRQVLVTGYVGSPRGLAHCDDVGHLFRKMINDDGSISTHCVRTVHAEQNAICQAARRGIALEGATLYCRMTPCRTCAMLIINCGISRVVCQMKYHAGAESEEMFRQAGIQLEFFCDQVLKYDKQ